MKNVEMTMTEAGVKAMNRMLKIILLIVVLHTALIVYAAFYMSNESWLFISGGLFYIIFAAIFILQILYYKIKAFNHNRSISNNRN
jgi:F0F1-type ATP synthase assembly protein I